MRFLKVNPWATLNIFSPIELEQNHPNPINQTTWI